MSIEIKNKLNIWKWEEPCHWYRIDRKIGFFFRKIKWAWQRAKYGYCDRDLWNLDYTLGNYIASSVNKLADISHGHPYQLTPEEWDGILKSIARNFYLSANEEEWENPYESQLPYGILYTDLSKEQKEIWDNWFQVERKHSLSRDIRRQEGFKLLQDWFLNLWD